MSENNLEAKKKAMSLLMHKDRTEYELVEKLKQKGFSQEETEDALSYVKGFGYIDDVRYAERYIEIYQSAKSRKRLEQDLSRRGIDSAVIGQALEKCSTGDQTALEKEIFKKTGMLEGISEAYSYEEKQKIMAYLFRKGFQSEDIRRYFM